METASFDMPTLAEWTQRVLSRPKPRYLIHNFLPADNLVLLSGQPKDALKTWLAMTAALVVATGRKVGPFVAPEALPVLYIYMEGAEAPTLNRWRAIGNGNGLGDVTQLGNLYLMHRSNFYLDRREDIVWLAQQIDRLGIALVVIDTLAKSVQADENSSKEVGVAIRSAEILRNAGATVMLVHHLRKETPKLSGEKCGLPEPDSDLRGSSALAGAYETHWAVRAYPLAGSSRKQRYLLVGGKEFTWRQYEYNFRFLSETIETPEGTEEMLQSAAFELGEADGLQYVERPASARAKKVEE